MSHLLSEVPFGSLLVYSPRGSSESSKRSRRVRDAIKAGRLSVFEAAAMKAAELLDESGLSDFLGESRVLVPAPRSAPLTEGALWPAERACRALVRHRLGREVVPLLRRTEAVPKSAFARPGERPNAARHYETLESERLLQYGAARLTVVDDVVTKGSTLLAAASRLAETYPGAEVLAFALLRTRGLVPEIDSIVEPCSGRLVLAPGGEADRRDG